MPKFRKGRSGNPKGRPKGSKNLTTLIQEAARNQVSMEIDGKSRRISALQATVTQLATKAARGDQKAMVEFLDRIAEIEARNKPSDYPLGAPDVEVLRAAYERMKQCEPEEPVELHGAVPGSDVCISAAARFKCFYSSLISRIKSANPVPSELAH